VALGLVIGAIWVWRQRRLSDPMVDVSLFRLRTFDTALLINFLSIFVAVGYFLFVAQYLQLVVGLSPLAAGLWSLPAAFGFIVGSQAAPRLIGRIRPAVLIGGGLSLAAIGLIVLTQVSADGGLAIVVISSVVISLGLAPVFGLTTEMIVGSAPPERAGAASGISETAAELGGALGIAILGTIGVSIYRSEVTRGIPSTIPDDAAASAADTLGAAVAVAEQLPAAVGVVLLETARVAYVSGMQLTAGIAAAVAIALAIVAFVMLRPGGPAPEAEAEPDGRRERGHEGGHESGGVRLEPADC
jgi:DHA2 family multidrug resistance protein-like MFS transporter